MGAVENWERELGLPEKYSDLVSEYYGPNEEGLSKKVIEQNEKYVKSLSEIALDFFSNIFSQEQVKISNLIIEYAGGMDEYSDKIEKNRKTLERRVLDCFFTVFSENIYANYQDLAAVYTDVDGVFIEAKANRLAQCLEADPYVNSKMADYRKYYEHQVAFFNKEAVESFLSLLKEGKIIVIVSSLWKRNLSLFDLRAILPFGKWIVGVTPNSEDNDRSLEISTYTREHLIRPPNIISSIPYLIIDSDARYFITSLYNPRFIFMKKLHLFSDSEKWKALEYLNEQSMKQKI